MEEKIINDRVESIILKKWHLVLGTLGFLITFVFPVALYLFRIDKNQALTTQSIQTIQLNHEKHMEQALEEIKLLKQEDKELDQKLDSNHEIIIKLMTKIESMQ
jgi:hypothetical protein